MQHGIAFLVGIFMSPSFVSMGMLHGAPTGVYIERGTDGREKIGIASGS